MKLLSIIDEDIVNYKKISMYVAFPFCSLKCDIDSGCDVCQNSKLTKETAINVSGDDIVKRYLDNKLTHAIVLGGLEPFDSPFDLIAFVYAVRNKYECDDDIVIYTGYTEEELEGTHIYSYPSGVLQSVATDIYRQLKGYKNIIVKFGRFIPNDSPHFDEVLGVNLASSNQYAKEISQD